MTTSTTTQNSNRCEQTEYQQDKRDIYFSGTKEPEKEKYHRKKKIDSRKIYQMDIKV